MLQTLPRWQLGNLFLRPGLLWVQSIDKMIRPAASPVFLFAIFSWAQTNTNSSVEERLAAHRNLGKAFYENPTTQVQSVREFLRALELAPKSARERVNYGLALLRAGKTDEGIAELKAAQVADSSLPHTWFNLGIQYKKRGETAAALVQLRKARELAPGDAIIHYNIAMCRQTLFNRRICIGLCPTEYGK